MGWGACFEKIAEQFQGRMERLKNEHSKLTQEKKTLQRKKCDEKISLRISAIDDRIAVLNELLKNAAK